ncbi:glycosyltransferase family 4 protein [Haloferula sp.]|uniref:glycosyltransferase family 4 protein n=1 Tax=Haloferula sp. TaxID=2497595 RepID=UPI00329B91D6
MTEASKKLKVLLMGQTPPPWHGQAVATQILFEHDWPEFEVHRLRMEFSEEMEEVGRFQWKKIQHLFSLIREARKFLKENPGSVLLYPPASAKWIPFLRDVIFLRAVRYLAGSTVFIFHASGLPVFVQHSALTRLLGMGAYRDAQVSLEVAQEKVPPHKVFGADSHRWCPCAIEVPKGDGGKRRGEGPHVALFVASLQEGKGVLEILKTAADLRDKGLAEGFLFKVVGKWFSDAFESEARNLHQELGLDGVVEFVGQLTGDEKWEAYRNADSFFFPTHYASEASPIVLMEALGMGLPIISTQWAGIPAMLEGCETARLLPVRSPSDYADALLELADGGWGPDVAERAKAFYRDHFEPKRFIDRVGDAFKEAHAPGTVRRGAPTGSTKISDSGGSPVRISAYLADQNPKLGRSLGISRMTRVVLGELAGRREVDLTGITSRSSIQMPEVMHSVTIPWSTRTRATRVLTDHLHPLMRLKTTPDVWYFPKGFLPRVSALKKPAIVTIHDTIIQYYSDRYPKWRTDMEYRYWASILKNTLRRAEAILTVSESAKRQIIQFMDRHKIPEKEIMVTYEPCLYERIPQPKNPAKADYVLHLASREPHKRSGWLIRLWAEAYESGRKLPQLHVVGKVPYDVVSLVDECPAIVRLPFLDDDALVSQFKAARALMLPSEIEGFGLPAIEAYYLGTPVCFVKGTSVEEVLALATNVGGFSLDDRASFYRAFDEVLSLPTDSVRECGLKLREEYAADRVVDRMVEVFQRVAESHSI